MDLERTTPFIHRSQLSGEILTEEKRRLWQGPVHQVATKAHEIRVDDPRPSEQMCSKILSNISGGRVTDAFGPGRLDPWGDRSSDSRGEGRDRGRLKGMPIIAVTVCCR